MAVSNYTDDLRLDKTPIRTKAALLSTLARTAPLPGFADLVAHDRAIGQLDDGSLLAISVDRDSELRLQVAVDVIDSFGQPFSLPMMVNPSRAKVHHIISLLTRLGDAEHITIHDQVHQPMNIWGRLKQGAKS